MSHPTHPERLAALRAAVDLECIRRWEALSGRAWTEAERIKYDVAGLEYERSRAVERAATLHWSRLERALREASRWVASSDHAQGGHVASRIVLALPMVREALDVAKREAVSSGEAAFTSKPPSRATYIRDALEPLAAQQGLASPFDLPASMIAVLSLLSGWWPYWRLEELQFDDRGWPTPAQVISREIDRVRKFIPRKSAGSTR